MNASPKLPFSSLSIDGHIAKGAISRQSSSLTSLDVSQGCFVRYVRETIEGQGLRYGYISAATDFIGPSLANPLPVVIASRKENL
jgi:hypothetical protein